MAFRITASPDVVIREIDLTDIPRAVAASRGATAIQAAWGPVEDIVTISSENLLVERFGRPNSTTYKDFFPAANFLSYTNNLQVVRVIGEDYANAATTGDSNVTGVQVKNLDDFENQTFTDELFIARYPGDYGNNIGVAWADTTTYDELDSNGDNVWPWAGFFTDAPETDEYHVVVYDATGDITGREDALLERFEFVSTDEDAKYDNGRSSFVDRVINQGSAWIWVGNSNNLTGGNAGVTLGGGADGSAVTTADYTDGHALFQDTEVDVNLLFASGAGREVGKWMIDNVALTRLDLVAFVSPDESDCVGITDRSQILENILDTRATYGSTSYAVMDGAFKYQYDRYNDVYRWVALNGDIAGLCARTDRTNDPWWSPAGYNRGRIKNVVKFSWKQNKTFRDELFRKNVNPVVMDDEEGAVLLGDKTLQARASAFDAINVRRLFIVLEKSIASASKYKLFEFNDSFTRNNFVNMVSPTLREVQGRRGLTSFDVKCDDENNPPSVIDRNEFVASIFVAPNRAIRGILLNFVATPTGVNFEEIELQQ